MTFREDDVRREHSGRFAAKSHSAPEVGLLGGLRSQRRAKRDADAKRAEVRGRLSDADLRALDVIGEGQTLTFIHFKRKAFPGLFTRRKTRAAMMRLAAAGAVEVYEYAPTWAAETLEIHRPS